MNERLALSPVALHAVCWSDDRVNLDRTRRVLHHCRRLADFHSMLLYSYLPVPAYDRGVRGCQIPQLKDFDGYNVFVNTVLPRLLLADCDAGHFLTVHEDGFPLEVSRWDDGFLDYDYVGAPWADGVVGNNGFCLESRRLLEVKRRLPFSEAQGAGPRFHEHSDVVLCRQSRALLEAHHIRFAPVELALQFSTEGRDDLPSFGFHGRLASPGKYADGWARITALDNAAGSV